MKKNILAVLFWIISVILVAVIIKSSSQKGEETASITYPIAVRVAEEVFNYPDVGEIEITHYLIRQVARIGLFGILGISIFTAYLLTVKIKKMLPHMFSVIVLLTIFGFADELRKLGVEGRHFSFDETVLNVISSALGVLVVTLIYEIHEYMREKRITSR